MTRFYFAPLTLLVLGACNTEQAYWDLINGHGVTWDTTAASTGSEPWDSTSNAAPTTSSGGGGGDGASNSTDTTSGTSGFDAGTSTGVQLDQPPEVKLSVTPEDVESAVFVDLAVTCTDDVGVTEVRFFVDDALLAAVTELPYTAKWPVKSTDKDGPRTVRAECEDTAGQVVVDEHVVDVTLPASGSEAWSVTMPSKYWNTEALDASPAPDGSWWVCGYDSEGGAASMWIAHFAPDGEILFNEHISRGQGFYGVCSGIEAFPDDPHRAALTGTWVKDWFSPLVWTGVVDETRAPFIIAENKDNYLGEYGNDVAVTPKHQVRITGYRLTGDNSILTYRAFTFSEDTSHLAHLAADEYDSEVPGDLQNDAGEAIVVLPDGRTLIAGRAVHEEYAKSRGIVALVGADHKIVKGQGNGWPFLQPLTKPEGEGFNDVSVTSEGVVAVTGWWQQGDLALRPRLIHFDLADPGTFDAYTQMAVGGEFVGQSLARLSTGPVMVAARMYDPDEKDDIWIEQYTATGWDVDPKSDAWPRTFAGFYQGNDGPNAIRVSPLDEILVVGYETIQKIQNGNFVTVRQAWVRAFEG